MLPVLPVALGIAALAALLSSCGGDESVQASRTPPDGGDSDSSGTGGTQSAGTGGTSATGGRGGANGSGGSGGSGGKIGDGGVGGIGEGGMDAGGMGGVGGDGGSTPDAGSPIQVPYHFGMIYGSNSVKALRGTGTLLFSNLQPCQLVGGSFNAEYQTGGSPFQMTVDLMPNQSINFCSAEVTLPLAGGVFAGVDWLLTNRSNPLSSKKSWEVTACSPETTGGVENCSGALELTTP